MLCHHRSVRSTNLAILTVPGWHGSGPGHWQSIWERKYPEIRRVEQKDWNRPRRCDWVQAIDDAINVAAQPVILVAHSLGCIAVACWAEASSLKCRKVAAALLVAPPDLACATKYTEPLRDFAPMPQAALHFRSLLISSENDPYMTVDAARQLAGQWGSDFINAGRVGHINRDAGFGEWPDGELYLQRLLR